MTYEFTNRLLTIGLLKALLKSQARIIANLEKSNVTDIERELINSAILRQIEVFQYHKDTVFANNEIEQMECDKEISNLKNDIIQNEANNLF